MSIEGLSIANCEAFSKPDVTMLTEEEKQAIVAQGERDKSLAQEPPVESEVEPEAPAEGETRVEEHSQIDYEAELQAEKKRREDAERAAAEKDFKLRELKRREEEPEVFEDDDRPITKKELNEILQRDRQQTVKELQSSRIREKVSQLTSNEAEANYIIELHKNRIFPESTSIDEQLEECYAIANRKKLLETVSELKRANVAKGLQKTTFEGTHQDSQVVGEPQTMSSQDVTAIKASGYIWDGALMVYKKPLPKGKFLFFDPKTKKRWSNS